MCIYVCMCVVCVCIYPCTCMCGVYECMYKYVYVSVLYVYVFAHVCDMGVYVCVCTYMPKNVCGMGICVFHVYVCPGTCMWCVCAYMCIYVCEWYVYICSGRGCFERSRLGSSQFFRGEAITATGNMEEPTHSESASSPMSSYTVFIRMKMRAKGGPVPWEELPYHVWAICTPSSLSISFFYSWVQFSEKRPFTFSVKRQSDVVLCPHDQAFFSHSIPVTASLPPLEWPLSNQSGSYELRIEVQPKPHHRAHYETEGSRGAVKAPTGGHPVVQVWTQILFLLYPMMATRRFTLLAAVCESEDTSAF